MSDQVIVFVADAKFLPHVPSIAVNCRREGGHTGDFLLIHPDDVDVTDFMRRGFASLPVPDRGFLQKFNLFHPFLKVWKQALFLDCDCMVQGPLSQVWEQMDAANSWKPFTGPQGAVGWQNPETGVTVYDGTGDRPHCDTPIFADKEEVPVFMGWQVWDKEWREHEAIYETMNKRFPHVFSTDKMFNTSMVAWEPGSIADDTVERLRALQAEFEACNRPENGGTDEPIIDLLLHSQMRKPADKAWCYWGLDEFASRVPSESRGWKGGEIPVVIHYGRWHAPWIVKTPEMDAYDNNRIGSGVVCHEFYQQNLADFETVFPKE